MGWARWRFGWVLMYRAYMGERWVAPVVGEMAQKLA